MIIPKKHIHYLTFLHNGIWYKITANPNDRNVYSLYKPVSGTDYELLGTGNSPLKLEEKVYAGKYK